MTFRIQGTTLGLWLIAAVFTASTVMMTSCATAGSVKVKLKFPLETKQSVEVELVENSSPVTDVKVSSRKKHGPPPHAPAHGYRHKHRDGTELVFDKDLGIYIVVGISDIFFFDELYIRSDNGSWKVSASLEGPWRKAKSKEVPLKLKSRKRKKLRGNSHLSKWK